MLARITARELAEWREFELLEGPFGDRRSDYNAALIVLYTLASAGAFEDGDVPPLENFLITYGPPPDDETDEDAGGGQWTPV